MKRTAPPFRADHVGSLLRPASLKEARIRRERGEISAAELTAAEDSAIERIIARQAQAGLRSATDGEFRRAMWHFDFLERLDGVESFRADHGIAFKGGIETQPKGLRVYGKLGFSGHPMLEHFRFLRDRTPAVPKMTIPSPSVLHFRGGRRAVDPGVYPDMDAFYRDLGQAYRGAVQAFADEGCRYLQLDEVNLAYLCDPEQRQMLRDRGDDPERLPQIYAEMINTAISGRPADMTITMHLCRGNFRSSWIAQGGYEPVAELLFHENRSKWILHGVRQRARRRIRAIAFRPKRQNCGHPYLPVELAAMALLVLIAALIVVPLANSGRPEDPAPPTAIM